MLIVIMRLITTCGFVISSYVLLLMLLLMLLMSMLLKMRFVNFKNKRQGCRLLFSVLEALGSRSFRRTLVSVSELMENVKGASNLNVFFPQRAIFRNACNNLTHLEVLELLVANGLSAMFDEG